VVAAAIVLELAAIPLIVATARRGASEAGPSSAQA
jgi:hypothetical protein